MRAARLDKLAYLLLLQLFIPSALLAQPDLGGYWLMEFGPIPPSRSANSDEQSLIDTLESGTLLLADSGLTEFPPGEHGGLKISERALAEAEAYDIEMQRQVSTTCLPPSIIYSMQGPFPIEIFQGRDIIVIKMEYFDVVRIIFMNEEEHPENWAHSVTGHSIGRWDGDTLLVDTTFIQASTLLNNGVNHSDDMRLKEKFRLSNDGNTLLVLQEYEDPAMFAGKAARIIPMNKFDDHVYPYACDPSYGSAIQNREQ